MARPIWRGSLSFGLVNVPVGLYATTDDRSVRFHQFEEGTSDRIRYRRVNERTGKEVAQDRIVRGAEVSAGEYVIVTDDELEAIAPERSRSIEISDFVDLRQIDPVFYQTTYYLAPQGEPAARAYGLLRAAMAQSEKVGIAYFVLRGKEHLVAVRPDREVLALETMYFADEIRDPEQELPDLPGKVAIKERELETAKLLIDTLTTEWDPTAYRSSYRDKVNELIERKRRGETVTRQEEPDRSAQIVNLMDALDASLRASRGGGTGRRPASGRSGGSGRRRATEQATDAPPADPPGRGRSGRRTASSDSEADVGGMTKAQLTARAAELGVAGRSKMDRKQLEQAVRRAARRRVS